jgi:hypothetical protein
LAHFVGVKFVPGCRGNFEVEELGIPHCFGVALRVFLCVEILVGPLGYRPVLRLGGFLAQVVAELIASAVGDDQSGFWVLYPVMSLSSSQICVAGCECLPT